jgi:hypothetical protein
MKDIASFLKKRIQGSIKTDVIDVARFHSRRDNKISGGFFSIPRLVFCYVDFLGQVAFSGGNTETGERFLKEFFPPNYRNYAELVYSMFRHGTVHEFFPKTFFVDLPGNRPRRIRIKWLLNNTNKKGNRAANMKFFPMAGKNATIHCTINTCQIADDLLSAFDVFMQRLETNPTFRRESAFRLQHMLLMKNAAREASIRRDLSRKSTCDQMVAAWKNRSNKIDAEGRPYRRT